MLVLTIVFSVPDLLLQRFSAFGTIDHFPTPVKNTHEL
jgi:hypothetical protein